MIRPLQGGITGGIQTTVCFARPILNVPASGGCQPRVAPPPVRVFKASGGCESPDLLRSDYIMHIPQVRPATPGLESVGCRREFGQILIVDVDYRRKANDKNGRPPNGVSLAADAASACSPRLQPGD